MSRDQERYLRQMLPMDVTRDELKCIRKKAAERWKNSQQFRWMVLPLVVVVLVTTFLVHRHVPLHWFGGYGRIGRWMIGTTILMLAFLAFYRLLHGGYEAQLRAVVREHGYEVCGNCGYYLARLPATVQQCPECGDQREPVPSQANQS